MAGAFGGGADHVAFSDVRHIRPDTEDMLAYVLGLRPGLPVEEEKKEEEGDGGGFDDIFVPPEGADPAAANEMRIQQLEALIGRLQDANDHMLDDVTAMRKDVATKEALVKKLTKEEEELNKESDEADKQVEELTARHNGNIDQKKLLEAEVADLTAKHAKLAAKVGDGVGGPNKGRGASFKQVFESDDPEVQKEAREAKVESLSFEKLHAGRMPGWLSRTEMEQAERADTIPPPSRGGSVGGGGSRGGLGTSLPPVSPTKSMSSTGRGTPGRGGGTPKAGSSGGGAQVRGF
jgi:hypothetical protein